MRSSPAPSGSPSACSHRGDRPRRAPQVQPARVARGAVGLPARGCLSGRRLQARPDRAAAPRSRRRRHKSAAIAAASIVAKVTRDRYMRTADALYPGYGFASHVGYITPVAHGDRARARAVRDPPPLVAGACLPHRRRARRGIRLSGAPRGGTACVATACSTTNCWAGGYELDLVVRRGRVLVFVEVKSKAGGGFGDPLEMVTPVKVERVHRAAEAWLLSHPRARRPRCALRRGRGAGRPAGGRAGRVLADVEPRPVATQEQLYAGLDLDLSWSERDLPERERTKHVHRLHPYLGKYIPQLVEELSAVTCPRVDVCSIRSPGPGRRSCRRSSPGSTRRASTSRRSTAF